MGDLKKILNFSPLCNTLNKKYPQFNWTSPSIPFGMREFSVDSALYLSDHAQVENRILVSRSDSEWEIEVRKNGYDRKTIKVSSLGKELKYGLFQTITPPSIYKEYDKSVRKHLGIMFYGTLILIPLMIAFGLGKLFLPLLGTNILYYLILYKCHKERKTFDTFMFNLCIKILYDKDIYVLSSEKSEDCKGAISILPESNIRKII